MKTTIVFVFALLLPAFAAAQSRVPSKFCLECFGNEAFRQEARNQSACQVCAWQQDNNVAVSGAANNASCSKLLEIHRVPGQDLAFQSGTVEHELFGRCVRMGSQGGIVFGIAPARPEPVDRPPMDAEALEARKAQLEDRARALRAARHRVDVDRHALAAVDEQLGEADQAAAEAAQYDPQGRLLLGPDQECPAGAICVPRDADQHSAFTVGAGGIAFDDFGTGAGMQAGVDLDLKSTTWSPTLRVSAGGMDLDANADKFVCVQAGALTPIARGSAVSVGALAGWCGRGHDQPERGQSNLVHAGPVLEIGSDAVRLEIQGLVGGLRGEEIAETGEVSHPRGLDFGVGAFLKGRFPFGEPSPAPVRGRVRLSGGMSPP